MYAKVLIISKNLFLITFPFLANTAIHSNFQAGVMVRLGLAAFVVRIPLIDTIDLGRSWIRKRGGKCIVSGDSFQTCFR